MTRLSEIADVDSGNGFPIADQGNSGQEFPFLKVSDMNLAGNEMEIRVWNHSITESVRDRLRAKVFFPGTVIFPKIGAAIATNKKRLITVPSCIDNNCMGVTADPTHVEPEYLYYLFRSKNLSDFASDSNPPSIRKSEVESWDVPVPTLEEQRRIVDLLSRAENVVQMRREAEAKAKEIIPALFVDGNREGSGISVSRREAARTVTLGDEQIVRIIDGDRGAQYPKKSDFSPRGHCLFLNTSNVRRGSWDFSKCDFISSQKDQSLRKGKLQRGDVILTTRGTLGYSAHFDARVPFDHVRINSGMVLLRTNPDVLLPEYLLGLVNSRTFEQQVESLTSGSAQPQLPIRALTKIAFTLPEISTQRLIASRFNQASDLWITQRSATALSEHAFQSLLAGVFGAES